jgi:hypothetical protein
VSFRNTIDNTIDSTSSRIDLLNDRTKELNVNRSRDNGPCQAIDWYTENTPIVSAHSIQPSIIKKRGLPAPRESHANFSANL